MNWISGVDRGLRTLIVVHQAVRPNPAADVAETDLTAQERAPLAGLMRVNHTGGRSAPKHAMRGRR